MVHRYKLGMGNDRHELDADHNAVFDVESYVGHGLLSFYLEVW